MRQEFIAVAARGDGPEGVRHIVERRWLRNLHIGEILLVARRVLEIIMRSLELVADEERLVFIVLGLEPVQGGIGDGVGGMFAFVCDDILRPRFFALHTKLGVEILPLPGQHLVVVEVRLHFQVPLADHRCLVACLAEQNGQGLFRRKNTPGQIGHAIDVRVLPRDDARPARRAN